MFVMSSTFRRFLGWFKFKSVAADPSLKFDMKRITTTQRKKRGNTQRIASREKAEIEFANLQGTHYGR
ncbi:hypothetical protein GWI33_020383 [Rhynchophorus ferrugineus]|uniref:Uncharacterized protein n=1 Tax=Rhynchophorus ferrugineus TaxID=354439 RepID=A0A834M4C1_RHYFE|nr:hypothetical protein GWI33_020383 [Rhynchophorus ferrugineus]